MLASIDSNTDNSIYSLREKCPQKEYFLVRIFPEFNPNMGKNRPEKTPYLDTFHTVTCKRFSCKSFSG